MIVILLLIPCILLTACSSASTRKKTKYVSECSILIAQASADQTHYSSSDLVLNSAFCEDLEDLLNSDAVHSSVKQAYPNIDYTAKLECNDNTDVVTLVVISTAKEDLPDICNMIANNFCKVVERTVENTNVSILSKATSATSKSFSLKS